ncbi:DMT family transporter [Halorientalis sp.]|uniref:DMT family transporter n=1 Tax=Halorientalis sp. TaxID=1931229 RepID=UPI00262D2BBE|nr:multidrug efflux SMR transporter [Halorientalis sp.]
MNPYALLAAAIASELVATVSLKLSQGFSKPLPSLGVVVGYGVAFALLSLVLEELPIGMVYATWAALGIVGIAAVGVVAFGERLDPAGVAGIACIVLGVVLLNVVSETSAH